MIASSLLVCLSLVPAQGSTLLHTPFDKDEGGWTSITPEGKVSVVRDAALLKVGTGSLKFEFSIAKGQMGAAILPTPDGVLAKMKSLKFWVRPDHDTSFAVVLQEKDGGRYMALCSAAKDAWQRIELSPSDFQLNDGPGDPKDPNNKLDLDKVEGIALADFSQFFAQADEAMAKLFNVGMGPHAFYVSDFQAQDAAIAEATGRTASGAKLDGFERPQLAWVCAGKVKLALASSGPIASKAMKADYAVSGQAIAGFFRPLPVGILTGQTKLSLSLASQKATKLIVQVEERGGGKYNAVIDLDGGSVAKTIEIAFKDMNPADDSKDANGTLDLDQVKQILILDVSGWMGTDQTNTLWIGPILAKA